MPSFDSVNYSIRPRKNIERKLIAELLLSMEQEFNISTYQYIGMGSLWFSDFIAMHKTLGIRAMSSIEKYSPLRAKFNSPFGFINVIEGTAKDEVPRLLKEDLSSIVWLDYDHDLSSGIIDDLLTIGRASSSGDFFIVTANAHHNQIKPPRFGDIGLLTKIIDGYIGSEPPLGEIGMKIPKDTLGPLLKESLNAIHSYHLQQTVDEKNRIFSELTCGIIPGTFSNTQFSEKNFPELVSMALITALDAGCRESGKDITFETIFNFFYKDGAPMVTIGGIAINKDQKAAIKKLSLADKFFFAAGKQQVSIDVPNLTPQEKIKLDSLLTRNGANPTARQMGLEISEEAISDYCRFYKQYPLFSEIF